VLVQTAMYTRLTRGSLLDVLGEDLAVDIAYAFLDPRVHRS
jgi:ABC-type dipeptide/oligopeptide/nickel transport system permease component